MTTWIKATGEHGLRVAFAAESVVAVMENRLLGGGKDHGPMCMVTFADGRYVDIYMAFDVLYDMVTAAQGHE